MNLYRVIRGERPLSYSVSRQAEAYVRHVRRERKHEQDVRERPLQFRVVPGEGPVVGWRQGSPPRGMEPNAPKGTHNGAWRGCERITVRGRGMARDVLPHRPRALAALANRVGPEEDALARGAEAKATY